MSDVESNVGLEEIIRIEDIPGQEITTPRSKYVLRKLFINSLYGIVLIACIVFAILEFKGVITMSEQNNGYIIVSTTPIMALLSAHDYYVSDRKRSCDNLVTILVLCTSVILFGIGIDIVV